MSHFTVTVTVPESVIHGVAVGRTHKKAWYMSFTTHVVSAIVTAVGCSARGVAWPASVGSLGLVPLPLVPSLGVSSIVTFGTTV